MVSRDGVYLSLGQCLKRCFGACEPAPKFLIAESGFVRHRIALKEQDSDRLLLAEVAEEQNARLCSEDLESRCQKESVGAPALGILQIRSAMAIWNSLKRTCCFKAELR